MSNSKAAMVVCKHLFPSDFHCRMWNLVSRQNSSLLQRHPSQSDLVKCDGTFDNNSDVEVTIKDSIKDHYVLLFNGKYAVVANGEGGPIKAVDIISPPVTPATDFKPIPIGIYWSFQTKTDSELYLGCQEDGYTTLVKMKSKDFPNPQALFIVNQIN